jgi:hypothetical protein
LEKPKVTYPFREADILAYAGAMSTEKKNEKWKTLGSHRVTEIEIQKEKKYRCFSASL